MNCPICTDTRMACKFTYPICQMSRFRVYQCPECKRWQESVEISMEAFLGHTPEMTVKVMAEVNKAKAIRASFARGRREGSGAATGRKGALMLGG